MSARIQIPHRLVEYTGGKDEFYVESGDSIKQTLKNLGLDPSLFALIVVNGVNVSKEYIIKDNDQIKALAIIGGG